MNVNTHVGHHEAIVLPRALVIVGLSLLSWLPVLAAWNLVSILFAAF